MIKKFLTDSESARKDENSTHSVCAISKTLSITPGLAVPARRSRSWSILNLLLIASTNEQDVSDEVSAAFAASGLPVAEANILDKPPSTVSCDPSVPQNASLNNSPRFPTGGPAAAAARPTIDPSTAAERFPLARSHTAPLITSVAFLISCNRTFRSIWIKRSLNTGNSVLTNRDRSDTTFSDMVICSIFGRVIGFLAGGRSQMSKLAIAF